MKPEDIKKQGTDMAARGLLFKLPLIAALIGLSSCALDDEDRCPDGYFYVPEHLVCCKESTHVWDAAARSASTSSTCSIFLLNRTLAKAAVI